MQISELHLKTRNLSTQKAFYQTTIGLPLLEETATSFTFQAGATRLTFHTTAQENSFYHFALTIPHNKLAQAKQWLAERTPLLTQNGQDEFPFQTWDARSVYFRDPAGNIGELIVHYSLPDEAKGEFSARDLLYVSEIGLVVDDVRAQVDTLKRKFALQTFQGEDSDTFTVLGDARGRFIVVKTGRIWYPTSDTAAVIVPLDVTIEGSREKNYRALPYPYTIRTTPDSLKTVPTPDSPNATSTSAASGSARR
ncbi:MAG TPA: hypothetical protein VKR06_13870 [Ktedonosporobacter sp.]|nr:hypothetical protein [Ktedonosporobacter sp.]